jgi:hypothetical protein
VKKDLDALSSASNSIFNAAAQAGGADAFAQWQQLFGAEVTKLANAIIAATLPDGTIPMGQLFQIQNQFYWDFYGLGTQLRKLVGKGNSVSSSQNDALNAISDGFAASQQMAMGGCATNPDLDPVERVAANQYQHMTQNWIDSWWPMLQALR